ncbi:hypothetical protein M3J09_010081 [Ascochyta lentis]
MRWLSSVKICGCPYILCATCQTLNEMSNNLRMHGGNHSANPPPVQCSSTCAESRNDQYFVSEPGLDLCSLPKDFYQRCLHVVVARLPVIVRSTTDGRADSLPEVTDSISQLTDRSYLDNQDLGRILPKTRYSFDSAASHRSWTVHGPSSEAMMPLLRNDGCAGFDPQRRLHVRPSAASAEDQ